MTGYHNCPWCQCPPPREPNPRPDPGGYREMTKNWERTTHGYLICPHCGKTGYTLGRWLEAHKQHAECWVCGKVVTARGLKIHARIHARE